MEEKKTNPTLHPILLIPVNEQEKMGFYQLDSKTLQKVADCGGVYWIRVEEHFDLCYSPPRKGPKNPRATDLAGEGQTMFGPIFVATAKDASGDWLDKIKAKFPDSIEERNADEELVRFFQSLKS